MEPDFSAETLMITGEMQGGEQHMFSRDSTWRTDPSAHVTQRNMHVRLCDTCASAQLHNTQLLWLLLHSQSVPVPCVTHMVTMCRNANNANIYIGSVAVDCTCLRNSHTGVDH